MPMPTHYDLMQPLLQIIADGRTWTSSAIRSELSSRLNLSEEELQQLLPSGRMTTFASRVHWAKTYLEKAGAVESPARGEVRITERGRMLLQQGPVHRKTLQQFDEFVEWKQRSRQRPDPASNGNVATVETLGSSEAAPEESIESAHNEHRSALEDEILEAIKAGSPALLERIVVELLVALGYGGAGDSGKHLGRSGDGGVDGVIWEDKLGLDLIYVQAKRWQNTVGRPEIQAFSGSLDGFRARKGVFITTSTFTREARDYVGSIEKKIVLIDGHELARLLFDTELGVSTERTYAVKRLDSDYFAEDF